jgi:multidrug transporter EmrE-like cation transporter
MKTLLIAIISILISVAAQFSLKAGMSSVAIKAVMAQPYTLRTLFSILTEKYIFGGFLLYGLGAIIWLSVLSKWDVSKAYPLVGVGFVFTAAIGFIAGEQVTLPRIIGIALICAGVFMMSRG